VIGQAIKGCEGNPDLLQPQVLLQYEAGEPSACRSLVSSGLLAGDDGENRERVLEVHLRQLGGGPSDEGQVASLNRTSESRVGATLDRHERMFASRSRSVERVPAEAASVARQTA